MGMESMKNALLGMIVNGWRVTLEMDGEDRVTFRGEKDGRTTGIAIKTPCLKKSGWGIHSAEFDSAMEALKDWSLWKKAIINPETADLNSLEWETEKRAHEKNKCAPKAKKDECVPKATRDFTCSDDVE
jgi:hypothetical protein